MRHNLHVLSIRADRSDTVLPSTEYVCSLLSADLLQRSPVGTRCHTPGTRSLCNPSARLARPLAKRDADLSLAFAGASAVDVSAQSNTPASSDKHLTDGTADPLIYHMRRRLRPRQSPNAQSVDVLRLYKPSFTDHRHRFDLLGYP